MRTVNNIDIFPFFVLDAVVSFLSDGIFWENVPGYSSLFVHCVHSLCFRTSARPCSFASGPYLLALAMKSCRRNLWPATKPVPQHQIINMSIWGHITVELCVHVPVHACTTSHFCVCSLHSASCNPIQNFACASTKNWQQTEIEHRSWSHIPTHRNLDFSITSKREFLTFFFIHGTSEFTSKVKICRLIGVTFSPLTISDWEGEVVSVGCSHLKSCTCSNICVNKKAWLSIFTCNLCIIGIKKQN